MKFLRFRQKGVYTRIIRQATAMRRQPQCVCVNLRNATRALTQLYDSALASAGVKVTQFSLLRAIQRNEPAAITMLAEDLDLDRTTLTRNLVPLQREHLVALGVGADQRVTEVRLTAKGRKAIDKALPLWQRVQDDIEQRLGPTRVQQLRELAVLAIAAAQESTPPADPGPKR
jgi:DNA-binding MarR family transcriptional regulator